MSDQNGKKARSGTVEQVVRCADGNFKKLRLTRKLAMSAHCTECMGYGDPADCTAKTCALYRFRTRTYSTRRGNITAAEMDAQKANNQRGA